MTSRIARLVLTDGEAFDHFPPPSFAPVVKIGRRPAGVYALMSIMRPGWIRQRVHAQNVSRPLDPALTRRWIAPALSDRGVRRDAAKFLAAMDKAELVEVSTRLRRFTKPVVLLWGEMTGSSRSTSPAACASRSPMPGSSQSPGDACFCRSTKRNW